ncbi:MAG: hypothetical protein II877_05610 [Synergistaceae bacterium]|nr:hypothetical protein [Synergistaceae bacterium]
MRAKKLTMTRKRINPQTTHPKPPKRLLRTRLLQSRKMTSCRKRYLHREKKHYSCDVNGSH